jgi:hypothetical protein
MPKNKLGDLRNLMFETIERLLDEDNPMDVQRAKAVANVGSVIVHSAKVEVDFLREVGGTGSGFIPDGDVEPKLINGREN